MRDLVVNEEAGRMVDPGFESPSLSFLGEPKTSAGGGHQARRNTWRKEDAEDLGIVGFPQSAESPRMGDKLSTRNRLLDGREEAMGQTASSSNGFRNIQ